MIVGSFLTWATNAHDTQPAQKAKSALRDPIVWATVAIAVATLVLAGVGYLQYLTLEKQYVTLEKTDQTLSLQQRAWIAPRGITPTPPNFVDRINAYTEVFLPFENVGKELQLK